MFREITEIKVIKRANSEMVSKLMEQFPYKENRTIGWPSGHFNAQVRFNSDSNESHWWYSRTDGRGIINLFGKGNIKSDNVLHIDLQFNFPVDKFNRKQGGVFVIDDRSGIILLGHRGIVTRGKSRVPRKQLFEEANLTNIEVVSNTKLSNINLLLVSPINDNNLGDVISNFSSEIRRAANQVMLSKGLATGEKEYKNSKGRELEYTLKSYYDEFFGKTTFNRNQEVTMICRHGLVVKALCDKFKDLGMQYKSVEMDLVIETEKEVLLFEVKTGGDSQSIYTAIGQLYFHAAALSKKYSNKKLIRNLVIPCNPFKNNRQNICKELGIEIYNFSFNDLEVIFK